MNIRAGRMALLFITLSTSGLLGQGISGFNVVFENPYLSSGGSQGTSIHHLDDTLFVFGVVVDTDAMSIGIMLKYDLEGNALDTVTYDSIDPMRNVNIDDRFGGVERLGDQFVMKYAEFHADVDSASATVDSLTMIDRNGNILWKKALNEVEEGPEVIRTRKVKSHPYGGYLIVGTISDSSGTISSLDQIKGLLIRTDALGEILWHQRYQGTHYFLDLDVFPDGSCALGGAQLYSGPTQLEHMIIRTDELGNEVWRHHFGGLDNNGGPAACNLVMNDGRILGFDIERELPGFGTFRGPFLIDVLQDDGPDDYTELDEFHVDFRDEQKAVMNAIEDSQGRVIMIGVNSDITNEDPTVQNGYMLALNNELDSLWSRQYRYYPHDLPSEQPLGAEHGLQDIVELPDGGFAMTGYATRPLSDPMYPGVPEIWVLRVDSMGCLEPGCHLISGLQEQQIGLQGSMGVYPNPVSVGQLINLRFSPMADYTMPYVSERTELLLYDGQGRLVYTHSLAPRGTDNGFELSLDVPHLGAGLYTLQWVSERRNWYDGVQVVVE